VDARHPDGLICCVRKIARRGLFYAVTECYPYRPARGEACRDVRHELDYAAARCSCADPWPCLHARAVREADPLGGAPRYRDPRDG
jgi:hypothetical protein